MANRMPSALPGTLIASAFGAADGVLASSDINAGRSQTSIWARASLLQTAGIGFGLADLWFGKRRSAWAEPLFLVATALTVRAAAFGLMQHQLPTPQLTQGYAHRNYNGGKAGQITPPTIYVYGDPRNAPEQQAGGML